MQTEYRFASPEEAPFVSTTTVPHYAESNRAQIDKPRLLLENAALPCHRKAPNQARSEDMPRAGACTYLSKPTSNITRLLAVQSAPMCPLAGSSDIHHRLRPSRLQHRQFYVKSNGVIYRHPERICEYGDVGKELPEFQKALRPADVHRQPFRDEQERWLQGLVRK